MTLTDACYIGYVKTGTDGPVGAAGPTGPIGPDGDCGLDGNSSVWKLGNAGSATTFPGSFDLNGAITTFGNVSQININEVDAFSVNMQTWLGDAQIGDHVTIRERCVSGNYGIYELASISGIPGNSQSWGLTFLSGTNTLSLTFATEYIIGYTQIGPSGPTGSAGPQGPAGPDGADGTNGSDGVDGAQGPIGLTGAAGIDGTNGSDGVDGTTGPTGATGPIGLTGAAGVDGVTGAAGIDGTNGSDGVDGAQGPIGLTGSDGIDGIDGSDGVDGSTPPGTQVGQMNYWNGTTWQTINPGNAGSVLQLVGTTPTWVLNPDIVAPVITLTGNATVTIELGATYTDAGATATDLSGVITVVATSTVDTDIVGSYSVTYTATDASANQATAVVRTVNVVDTTVPVITLYGDATVTIEVGTTYTDDGATASDNYDGDITSSIVTASTVDTTIVGTYTVTYDVTDANSNAATTVTRTVNVVDAPVTDVDGNTYNSLTYGDQVWTVENAEMVTYRDGTPIPQVTDATEWENLTTGAWAIITTTLQSKTL